MCAHIIHVMPKGQINTHVCTRIFILSRINIYLSLSVSLSRSFKHLFIVSLSLVSLSCVPTFFLPVRSFFTIWRKRNRFFFFACGFWCIKFKKERTSLSSCSSTPSFSSSFHVPSWKLSRVIRKEREREKERETKETIWVKFSFSQKEKVCIPTLDSVGMRGVHHFFPVSFTYLCVLPCFFCMAQHTRGAHDQETTTPTTQQQHSNNNIATTTATTIN